MQVDHGDGRRPGDGAMTAEDGPIICPFCKNGRVTKRMEGVAFRQWSNKGYVHCRVMILMGTCDNCHTKSLDEEAEKIFDEAFQREYDKLP
jgi:hypothetical protein